MTWSHRIQLVLSALAAGAGAAALAFPQYAAIEGGIAAIALAVGKALGVQSEVAGDKSAAAGVVKP
jgi:hypothetical protein